MPIFHYIAKSSEGEDKTGKTEAKDKYDLAKRLREGGYILVSARSEEEKNKKIVIEIPLFNKVSFKDKIMLVRNLEVMVSTGIPLPRILNILALQTRSKRLKEVLEGLNNEITKGKTFSESLASFPDVFSELFCSMVHIGEETGKLEEVLKDLSNQMEKENELKSRIVGAMMYPAVIMVAMIGVGIVMLTMIVPKLAETFSDLGAELPAATQFIVDLGNSMANLQNWIFVILFFVVATVLFKSSLKTEKGKKVADSVILKMPIAGGIVKKVNSARIIRILSSLISSGVPIIKSLRIIADSTGNFFFKKSMLQSIKAVEKGGTLSGALEPYQYLYSATVIQMIKVGEETGETSKILGKLADFYEKEVIRATENLSAVVEPLMMLIIGVAVGFFAISMFQPIYSVLGVM